MVSNKPHWVVRLGLITGLGIVASLDRNPIVRWEAMLGLSPGPFERFTGMRTIFSGMTAAAHSLARLDLLAAVRSNVLSPFIMAAIVGCLATWRVPKATPEREPLMLGFAVAGSVLVDAGWRLMN